MRNKRNRYKAISKRMKGNTNAGSRKWNDEEIDQLLSKFATEDLEQLAEAMNRSVRAIVCKANKLGLNRQHNNSIVDGKKFCSYCKEWHYLDEFYRNSWKCDKYEYYCKKYYRDKKHKQDNIVIHKDKWEFKKDETTYVALDRKAKSKKADVTVRDGVEGKICGMCKEWLPLTSYYSNKNGAGGKHPNCKACYVEDQKRKKEAKLAKLAELKQQENKTEANVANV